MKKSMEYSQTPMMKTCSICNKSSEANGLSLIYFGEWMEKKGVRVHYYCLLLSTHLPQRGEDHSGILGFLLRDIRQEIALAKKRKCKYCFEMSASIQCCTCKKYFHLTCGHTSRCLSQFVGEFKSYCHDCVPVDQYEIELFARRPSLTTEVCFICKQIMVKNTSRWIYSKCCGNGFTHSKCMKIYAISAGYYLSCIWCKDKRFREDIKYQGVFVPDREANWEKEKGAYGELYRSYKRCDMEVCKCPKGRDFINAYKWQIITCKFCGSFGAHTPGCIPGFEGSKEKIQEFKCDVCSVTEQTIHHKTIAGVEHDLLDTSLYVNKEATTEIGPVLTLSQSLNTINTSCDSIASQETVINVNSLKRNSITPEMPNSTKAVTDAGSFQEALVLDDNTIANSGMDDNTIANLLVKRLLDMFEVQKYYKK